MDPPEFRYVNNIYSTRGSTPMLSTQSAANLEVLGHIQRAAGKTQVKKRPTSNVNPHKRDHLDEMWQGMKYGGDRNTKSSYRLGFAKTPAMAEELRTKDYSYHFKRDWIKEYTEAMCRHKLNIRPNDVKKTAK